MSLPKCALRFVILPLLLGLAAACDNQDGNPAGSGGPSGDSLSVQQFQAQAIMTFQTANSVAAGVDEIAHGDLSQIVAGLGMPGTARSENFAWDPAQG
ncbi:MAG: hypothetical protein ACRDGR_03665, partial [bacterium]